MTNTNNRPALLTLIAAFFAIYVIWGTTYLGISFVVETIPPFLAAGIRFMISGAILMMVMVLRGSKLPTLIHWRSAAIVGGLMLLVGNGILSYVEQWVDSGVAALVVGSMPIWVVLLEWLMFRGERPSLQTAIGLTVGFGGLLLLAAPTEQAEATGLNPLGFGLLMIGVFGWAIGGLYSRRAPLPEDTLVGIAAEMFAGGVLLVITSFILGEPRGWDVSAVSTRSLYSMIYLIVFGAIIGYTAYIWLMKNVDPAKVNTNFYVNPVIAIFAGWLLADETITPQMLVAAAVILLGVAIATTKLNMFRRKTNEPAPAATETSIAS